MAAPASMPVADSVRSVETQYVDLPESVRLDSERRIAPGLVDRAQNSERISIAGNRHPVVRPAVWMRVPGPRERQDNVHVAGRSLPVRLVSKAASYTRRPGCRSVSACLS